MRTLQRSTRGERHGMLMPVRERCEQGLADLRPQMGEPRGLEG